MAAVRDTRGRKERARSERGRAHRPALGKFYRGDLADIVPGDFEFTLDLIRGRGVRAYNLDPITESFSWEEADEGLTGSVSLRRPDGVTSPPVGNGHRIRCRTRWAGKTRWYEVWTMRVQPDIPEDPIEGTMDVTLKDDLDLLRRGKRKWSYRKTKQRRRGWRADEVVRHAARKEKVRLGRIAKGTKRFDKVYVGESTLLDLIKKAYELEKNHSGRRFIVRMRDGRLDVVPYQRNRVLYVLRDQIETASLTGTQKQSPVTVIEAKGRVGKGKDAKKVKATVMRKEVVRRFGKTVKEKDYGRVGSRRDLLHQAQRDLAKELKITRTADLSFPGVPFIRRGEGMRWVTNEPGWRGPSKASKDRSYVFVTAASHDVAAGGAYTTSISINQEDPFQKDRERRDKERREKKRKERKARKKK